MSMKHHVLALETIFHTLGNRKTQNHSFCEVGEYIYILCNYVYCIYICDYQYSIYICIIIYINHYISHRLIWLNSSFQPVKVDAEPEDSLSCALVLFGGIPAST
jgi:hypothetical protein